MAKTIQSIDRAFGILELFTTQNKSELSLAEIAAKAGIAKTTAFTILDTLKKLGYVQQNQDNAKYMLGYKLLIFSESIQKNDNLIAIARPYLQSLADHFNETVHCAVRTGRRIRYIYKVDSTEELFYKTQVGSENYLHSTGVGKAILAFETGYYEGEYAGEELVKSSPGTIDNHKDLKAEIDRIRRVGYALDLEEREIGLKCVAVPMMIHGQCEAAISISVPTVRMTEEKMEAIKAELLRIKKEIAGKYQ